MRHVEHKDYRAGHVFLLIFLLLSASIFIGGYFAYQNYKKNYRTEIEHQLSAVADLKVDQIEGWRKERLGDAEIFFKNALFSALVKRYIQNRYDREAKNGILTWVRQVQKGYNYDLMMLLDAQWNIILEYPQIKDKHI